MLKKQDRQGVRTAADLERKYNFTKMMSTSEDDKGNACTLNEADKAAIVSAVIAALPVYNGEVVTV